MLNYIYEAEAKSKSEAEQLILSTLRLENSDVKFVTVDSGRSGFFGLTSKKPAIVRAYVENKDIPIEKVIHGVTLTILKKMGIPGEVIGMGDVDGKIYIELSSPESGLIIGKRGNTLDAIQFLLNLIIDSRLRDGKKIILDIESYREKREMSLIRYGKSTASIVSKTNKSRLLESMNPYERRIIHMALQRDPKVFTRSEGNGTYKRVRIIPSSERYKYKDLDNKESKFNSEEDDNYFE